MYKVKEKYKRAFDAIVRSRYNLKDSIPNGLVEFSKNHDIADHLKELNVLDLFFDWDEPIELIIGKNYKLKRTPQFRKKVTTSICDIDNILKHNVFTYLGQYETVDVSDETGKVIKEKRNIFRSTIGSSYVEFSINFVNDYIKTEV